MRVVWAMFYLVVAQLFLIAVPYFIGWSIDALNDELNAPNYIPDLLLGPIALVISYNIVRVVQVGFNQLRDALFAEALANMPWQLAKRTFRHLHGLSLRFHLQRRTGGLSRVIERGTKGIESIVRFTILNTAPTILQFVLVAIIFGVSYGLLYVLIIAATI